MPTNVNVHHLFICRSAPKELRAQAALIGVQPCLGCLEVRRNRSQEIPERRTVRAMPEMGNFVGDDVLQHLLRSENEMPVDEDVTLSAA